MDPSSASLGIEDRIRKASSDRAKIQQTAAEKQEIEEAKSKEAKAKVVAAGRRVAAALIANGVEFDIRIFRLHLTVKSGLFRQTRHEEFESVLEGWSIGKRLNISTNGDYYPPSKSITLDCHILATNGRIHRCLLYSAHGTRIEEDGSEAVLAAGEEWSVKSTNGPLDLGSYGGMYQTLMEALADLAVDHGISL